MYGCGKNEELLAKVLKEDRKKVFLCTKFGNVRGPNGEFAGVSGTPEYPLFFLFLFFYIFFCSFPLSPFPFSFLFVSFLFDSHHVCERGVQQKLEATGR